MMKFRTLNADEIEVRVQQVTEKGAILLLYKDARCDMRVLDEEVGPGAWQRKHYELKGNIYASVGIRIKVDGVGLDTGSYEWVWKDDAGAESNTEAVKGEASDSFKRACFNWGIGRELYTSPFIWVDAKHITTYKNKQGKLATYDKFEIEAIEYTDGVIKALAIQNKKTKTRVYGWRSA